MIETVLESLGISPDDLLVVMAAMSAGMVTVSVWMTLLHRDPAARRIKIIAAQREALRAGVVGPRRRQERLPTISLMRRVVDRLNLLRSAQILLAWAERSRLRRSTTRRIRLIVGNRSWR
ncbi:MAG: hypothetical protein D6826_10240, partial [Alphaproteobacteria bacterium]